MSKMGLENNKEMELLLKFQKGIEELIKQDKYYEF